MTEKRQEKGRGAEAWFNRESFRFKPGMTGKAIRLTIMGVSLMVLQ